MKLHSFQDNSDSILIYVKDMVIRCDFHLRYIDQLYIHRHSHQRVLASKPLKDIATYDIAYLLKKVQQLIDEFTVPGYHILNVYRHDRNDRFVLLECVEGLRLELDKELNGIRDRSIHRYSSMYKRRPDNYYKRSVIQEYQRIHLDIKRSFDLTKRIIQLEQKR